jgi:hypothetical protein
MPFEQSDASHGVGQNDPVRAFRAREAERRPNIFPFLQRTEKGKAWDIRKGQKWHKWGLADHLGLGVLVDASPVGE